MSDEVVNLAGYVVGDHVKTKNKDESYSYGTVVKAAAKSVKVNYGEATMTVANSFLEKVETHEAHLVPAIPEAPAQVVKGSKGTPRPKREKVEGAEPVPKVQFPQEVLDAKAVWDARIVTLNAVIEAKKLAHAAWKEDKENAELKAAYDTLHAAHQEELCMIKIERPAYHALRDAFLESQGLLKKTEEVSA